tara:strand:- start:1002 stop:1952 length:951 start_codon:yes stop_codon:yes gene_type:complete
MKKLILSLVAIATLSLNSFGQAPEGFKYQAVVRDAGNLILNNQAVGMQLTIQQGSIGGTAVYIETFSPTSNAYGLVNIEIGSGNTTDDFSTIDWSAGPYFIETAMDATGGISYVVMGTSQLVSVPYALHANTAENVTNLDSTAIADLGFVTTSTCGLAIGDTYQGGIIFYLDASGCHGLISAPTDQSTGIVWWNGSYTDTYASGSGLFDGDGNCYRIRVSQTDCASCNAAELCLDLNLGGYSDWYLPSKYELNLMYQNIGQGDALGLGNVGGFANLYYWSSTEFDGVKAWGQDFANGFQLYVYKSNNGYVRSVRAF